MVFLIVSFSLTINCDLKENTIEVEEIVNLIKKRLAIYSLECDFTTIKSRYLPINRSTTTTGTFAMYNDNLFIMAPNTFSVTHARKRKSEKATNLIELLSGAQGYEEIESNIEGYSAFYRYKGICSNRTFAPKVSFHEDGVKIIEDTIEISQFTHSLLPVRGDPRLLIGFIGMDALDIYENRPKRRLVESLEKEGKFYLYQKENYKILWHECFYEDSLRSTDQEKLSFEVWIDNNNNITKIIEGDFPTRSFGLEYVMEICKKYNLKVEINCNQPNRIHRIIEFSDFKEFENDIRLPTKGKMLRYDYNIDSKYSEYFNEIHPKFERNEISFKEILTLSTICFTKKEKKEEIEIWIHPETLKVNQYIPDETFIPPALTKKDNIYQEDNTLITSWYSQYKLFCFISLFIIITMLGIFITKRFFGWNV